MATALSVGEVVRTTCWSVVANQAFSNTFHWKVTAIGGSPATDFDLADQVSLFYSQVLSIMSVQLTYKGCQGQIVTPVLFTDVISTSGAGAGADTSNIAPKQSCPITSWYTATANKHGRGRTFWPAPGTHYVDINGELTGPGQAAIDAVAVLLQGLVSITASGRTATIELSLYDRKTRIPLKVVTHLTRTKFATQRKRSDYGRANLSPV